MALSASSVLFAAPEPSISSESVLDRVSSHPDSSVSALQRQVDGMVGSFAEQATEWKSLAAMMAGGLAFRIGRVGFLGAASKLPLALQNSVFIQAGGALTGLATEVTVFEATHRSLLSLSSEGAGRDLWKWNGRGGIKEGWFSSFVNFGILKGVGTLSTGQNVLLQHVTQDLAMVTGHEVLFGIGLEGKPEGSFSERLLHAEITNLQLAAGMGLAHEVSGGRLLAWERNFEMEAKIKQADIQSARESKEALLSKKFLLPFAGLAAGLGVFLADQPAQAAMETASSKLAEGGPLGLVLLSLGFCVIGMAANRSGGMPKMTEPTLVRATAEELAQWRQYFSPPLLQHLFGRQSEEALVNLVVIFKSRPDLARIYHPDVFRAPVTPEQRKSLFKKLIADCHPPQGNLGKTGAQESLFNYGMQLYLIASDHLKILSAGAPASEPPRYGAYAPWPAIKVAGDWVPQNAPATPENPIFLGREHFFGDPNVSSRHAAVAYYGSSWFIRDHQSLGGTYLYEPMGKEWKGLPYTEWRPLKDGDLLYIGSFYYRVQEKGNSLQIEPLRRVPAGVEPLSIRKFTTFSWLGTTSRVELDPTDPNKGAGIQMGRAYFYHQKGKWFVGDLGEAAGIEVNGQRLALAFDPERRQFDPSKQVELRAGDRMTLVGKSLRVRLNAEDGSLYLEEISPWTTLHGTSLSDPAAEAARQRPPEVKDGVIRMGSADKIHIGRTQKETGKLEPNPAASDVYYYSLKPKPFLWGQKEWLTIEYNPYTEDYRVKNHGTPGKGLWVKNMSTRKDLPIAKGAMDLLKPGDQLVIDGQVFVFQP
ncbi:MAG: FHA domain-containing protein [bacterium]